MFSCYPCVNQDVAKQVRGYKKRYIQIEKPPTCKLDEGTYRLMSEPEGDIKPEVCPFVRVWHLLYIASHGHVRLLLLDSIFFNYVHVSLCRI